MNVEYTELKEYEKDDGTTNFNIKNDIGGLMFIIFFWTAALLISAFIMGWEMSSITWKKDAVQRGFAIQNEHGFQWIKQ